MIRLSLLILAFLLAACTQEATEKQPLDKEEVEAVLQDILQDRPELVIQAIERFQYRQQRAAIVPKLAQYRDYLEKEPDYPVLGNPDGDVTIVEFFDYRCGFCKRHFPVILTLLKEDDNIRFIPRQYPVIDKPGEPPVSRTASRAALAAHKQGKFREFHLTLMRYPGPLRMNDIFTLAGNVGIDVEQLKRDMQDKSIDQSIQTTLAVGPDLGFNGTPSYVIGNDIVIGAEGFESMAAKVASARAEKTSGR